MKKLLFSLSIFALAVAATSCDGYDDKELDKVVTYEPLKQVELNVGGTANVGAGAWTIDDTRVVKVNAEGEVTALATGVAYLDDTQATPHKMVAVTVVHETLNVQVGDEFEITKKEGKWVGSFSSSNTDIVNVKDNKIIAVAPGTCYVYNSSTSPQTVYKFIVE